MIETAPVRGLRNMEARLSSPPPALSTIQVMVSLFSSNQQHGAYQNSSILIGWNEKCLVYIYLEC